MELVLAKNLKINIRTITKFGAKFRSLKFYLKPLDYGICYPKRKLITTYFLCQPVDIILTDKDNIILKMKEDVSSERFIWRKRKTYFVYYLPPGASEYLEVGKKLEIIDKKKDDN